MESKIPVSIDDILNHSENREILDLLKKRSKSFQKNENMNHSKELTHPSLLNFVLDCTHPLNLKEPVIIHSYHCFYTDNGVIFLSCLGADLVLMRKNLKYSDMDAIFLTENPISNLSKWHEINPWFSGLEEAIAIKHLRKYFEISFNYSKKL